MCFSKGANDLMMKFQEAVEDHDLTDDVLVTNCGCFGLCTRASVAVVYPEGVFYTGITEDDIEEIVEQHLEQGKVVERLVMK
jgi:(2Fe-2S) ferredoxin